MAIDVYLQIEGIKGESTDAGHKEWIECSDVNWAIMQPRSATASTGGGHTAEWAELSDISFFKVSDLSSPILMQTCAMGKTIPKAKFEFMRADGAGVPVKYFEIELENVFVDRAYCAEHHWRRSHGRVHRAEILQDQMEVHSAKNCWRWWRQHVGRMEPRHQSHSLSRAATCSGKFMLRRGR